MLKEGFEPIPGYRLLNFLGRGQFGEVWRATSPGGTYIALKFLNVRERQGRKEFRAVQKVKGIRYPHLVQTYALWLLDEKMQVIDDAAFDSSQPILIDSVRATMVRQPQTQTDSQKPSMLVIATVLCDQNLMERLTDCKKKGERGIPPQELLGYIEDAAKAIDFLNAPRHELGEGPVAIHHCDIKPENIMILGDLAVVGDFGVARILGSGADSRATTTMGGSVAYAAPETFDNRTASTSDQYSLAITYYELRTGKLPFAEESQSQVMKDKLAGNLDLQDVSQAEAKVLRRALSVDPQKRFQSARSFVEALQVAVAGKRNGKRSAGIGTFAAVVTSFVLIVLFVALYLRPKVDDPKNGFDKDLDHSGDGFVGKEKEKVDGAVLYAETLQGFRQTDFGPESLKRALEKSILAIKEGGYVPVRSSAIGMELTQVFQTNADSLDENHCLKLIALSPDTRTLVKAIHHTLHFVSLESDQSSQIKLQDLDNIIQLAWLKEEIVLLDKNNRLTKVRLSSGIPDRDRLVTTQMAIPSEGKDSKNWLGMGRSSDRKKLFLLDGRESESIGTFKVPPGEFHISLYSEAGGTSELVSSSALLWKDRLPSVYADGEGKFLLAGSNYDGEIGTLALFRSDPSQRMECASDPAIKELQEFSRVQFLNASGSLFISGISKDTEEDYRLISGTVIDEKILFANVPLPNASPIGAICPESSESVLVAQSTKLLRCIRNSPRGEWDTKELFDFEDGLMPEAQEGAAGKINAVCKLNDRWVMTGHETGRSMILSQEAGAPPQAFEICPKSDCAIQDIWVTQNRVVLIGQDGRVIWFELADIILNAESCKKTGIAPRQTKSSSIRS